MPECDLERHGELGGARHGVAHEAFDLGELVGRALRLGPAERFTYVLELGFRNLGLAILVTVTLLGQEAFVAFAVVFFISAIVYALILTMLFRRRMT